ncbi:MAG: chemotaxis protein CheA [Chloroflexi bacterium]|jgi:chemotaxis protein histidine kinase CheA|nr:chemotaxis protein CheA [Chloroflexota bacterium]
MNIDMSAIIGEFQAEATEHIEILNAQLLELERDPSAAEPIRNMFLSAHTIKGSAAMLELHEIRLLAHAVEDVLARLRDTRDPLEVKTADLLFQALDMLRLLVENPSRGSIAPNAAVSALCDSLSLSASHKIVVETPNMVPLPRTAESARALLVDDSRTVRLLETMQLEDAGYSVDSVVGGQQALDLAVQNSYDLIVTGIECDGLTGWELVAALREVLSSRSTPIIMMSSEAGPRQHKCAHEAGVHDLLRKGSLDQQGLTAAAKELVVARGLATAERGTT